MLQISALMMLIANLGTGGLESEIDPFQYKNSTAAQTVWKAQWSSSVIRATPVQNQTLFQVETPPNQKQTTQRLTLDRELKKNLSGFSRFHIDIRLLNRPSGERLSLYFRSGAGWYVAGATVDSMEWKQLVFNKEDFREEGEPAGWDHIDGIRLSLWKGTNQSPKFLLRHLAAGSNYIAIIVPDEQNQQALTSFQVADVFESILATVNVNADRVTESSLQTGSLGERKLAILPHNPTIGPQACEVLNRFMKRGGKLFICYRIPSAIAGNFGIRQGTYYRPEKSEPQFSAIHFENVPIDGLPKIVKQNSWNITTGKPIGHHAKPIAYWYNERGGSTHKPAMIQSDRGIYFSHIPTREDWENKTAMMLALFGNLEPRLWKEIVRRSLEHAIQIGNCQNEQELYRRIRDIAGKSGLRELEQSEKVLSKIPELLSAKQGAKALAAARRFRKIREEAFLRTVTSKPIEARAFWEHAGTGAYAGDWERSMKELSAAGFNMILPNMLWGDAAHYASDVLPRSATFQKYGDQIEQCVAAAKKYGIEVHVWKVNFRCSHHGTEDFLARMKKQGRLQVDINGVEQPWLNPAHPENRKMEIEAMLEVVRKYDVAGIHFDYIRYPNGSMSFDDFSRKLFEKERNLKVKNWPKDCFRGGPLEKEYTDFRCAQITKLVEAVSREARRIKPQIKISAAVFREQPSARETVAQDWPLWVEKGYLDFICPMDYTEDDKQFARWIEKQKRLIDGKCRLYPGIGASSSRSTLPADRVAGQIEITRKLGADGYTIFNFNKTTADRVLHGLKMGAGKTKAIPPHRSR